MIVSKRNRQRIGFRGRLARSLTGRQSTGSALPVSSGLLAHWDFGLAGNLRPNADGSGSAVVNTGEIKWARDQSPNANHLTLQTAGGPTWGAGLFNGLGAARFDGAQALKAVSNLATGGSKHTIFVVGTRTGTTVGLGLIVVGGVTDFSVPGGNWFGMADVGSVWKYEASGSVVDYASTLPYDTRLRIFAVGYDNAVTPNRVVRGDGVELISGDTSDYLNTAGAFFVGGWSTNFVRADIAAVLVYDRQLSAAEFAAVELYLANLYGVYLPGVTWPTSYSAIQQASIYAATLNANMLGTASDPLKYHFDAENIDGLGTANASLTDGATQATWVNRGVTAGNATQATDALRPTLQKALANGQDGMMFGGNGDILTIASSAAGLSFIHNTNDWDLFVVGRKDLANRQVVLSNTDLTSEKGFVLDFDSTGKAHIKITNAVPGTTAELTWPNAQAVGDIYRLEVYGTAGKTLMRIDDLTGDTTNGTVASGDATNAASIGCLASTAAGSYDGAVFIILAFNKRVPPTQQNALFDYFTGRFGV